METTKSEETKESMVTNEPEELIVISDLHLSDGYDETTGKYSRNEDFFFDEEFKRFLEHLNEMRKEEGEKPTRKHLIINGDMFDFLQVDPDLQKLRSQKHKFNLSESEKKFGLGTEEDKTVWKLGEIAKGHKEFFEALANFISKGNSLSIISGNHDIELYWPCVREALKDYVAEQFEADKPKDSTKTKQDQEDLDKKKESIKAKIDFCHWFYYNKELKTYIEHGNQYDKLNSFESILEPRLKHDPQRLWVPFGSLFVRYFFNKLEVNNPFADNIKPLTKYMRWAWKEDKLQFLKTILRYLPTMIHVFVKGRVLQYITGMFLNIPSRIIKSQKDEVLTNAKNGGSKDPNKIKIDEYAKKVGLDPGAMNKIYSLKAKPFSGIKLLNILAFSTFTFVIISLVVSICLFLGFYRSSSFLSALRISLIPFASLIIPVGRWIYNKFIKKDYFEENMPKIKENLEKVQTIVFGHTHNPDIRKVNDKFWYVNSGTWTTVFSEEERIIREAKQFAFVRINDANKRPELLRWNPSLNEHQRLILFEPERKKQTSDKESFDSESVN